MREMVNCGVSWIGEIPKGWMVRRIKTLFSERTELSETGNETLMSVSEYYGVDSRASHIEEDEHLSRSESLIGYKKCYPGDIVSNIMLAWKGSLGVARQAGIVSPAYCVYMPATEVFPMYYHYLFRTSLYTWQFKCYSKGIIDSRLRLYSPFFYDIPALIPSVTEQRRIAEFLDSKCVEIDSISEKTRASIEEYKKLKQSVISEAVTKGIRGKRPMKDSGVECIGEIPEEWMVCRIKHVLTPGKEGIKIGPFGSALTNNVEGDGPFKIYGQWNIVNKDFSAGKNYVSKETFEVLGSYMVFTGDVLISMMGTIGKCAIIPNGIQPGIMDSHVIKARLNKSLMLDRYFELVFDKDNSVIIFEQMQKGKKGSIMDGLNSSIVKNLVIPCPPIAEQQEIAAYLDEKCTAIDSLIASKEALLAELEAYKKSLIYEYVTGKKEVPEA